MPGARSLRRGSERAAGPRHEETHNRCQPPAANAAPSAKHAPRPAAPAAPARPPCASSPSPSRGAGRCRRRRRPAPLWSWLLEVRAERVGEKGEDGEWRGGAMPGEPSHTCPAPTSRPLLFPSPPSLAHPCPPLTQVQQGGAAITQQHRVVRVELQSACIGHRRLEPVASLVFGVALLLERAGGVGVGSGRLAAAAAADRRGLGHCAAAACGRRFAACHVCWAACGGLGGG